jgi:hypothetical protein
VLGFPFIYIQLYIFIHLNVIVHFRPCQDNLNVIANKIMLQHEMQHTKFLLGFCSARRDTYT